MNWRRGLSRIELIGALMIGISNFIYAIREVLLGVGIDFHVEYLFRKKLLG